MQFAHILFLSLYALQAAGSYIQVDAQHEIAKRAPHKNKVDNNSSEGSGSSSSSSGSGKKAEDSHSAKSSSVLPSSTMATSITHSTTTHSSTGTSTATSTESAGVQPKFKNKKDMKKYLESFGETVKKLAIDSIGGIIVGAAVKEITGGSSGSGPKKEDTNMQAVQFVTTASDGSLATTMVTAAPSAFSTGSDSQIYIKTDEVSSISAVESSLINN